MRTLWYGLLSLCVTLGLLCPQRALASLVTFSVCVDVETDFEDAGMGDKLTADEHLGLGVAVKFIDASNDDTFFYMDWSGANAGCNNNVQLETTEGPFTVKVMRLAYANGNFIEVRPSPTSGYYATTVATNFTPISASFRYAVGPSDSVNILTAAVFALTQSNGGETAEVYTFFDDDCPGAAGASCATSTGIYIDPAAADEKRVIVHELGHAVATAANGGVGSSKSYTASVGDCSPAYSNDGHKMNSKEYASAAFTEGIAHFYSAIAFNDFDHNDDCELWKDGLDWNLVSGVEGPPNDPEQFSCDVGFDADPESIPEFDVLGWYCIDTGQSNNRATEYDFLRAGWDLVTYYDYPPETLFEIWAAADTDTWLTTGDSTGNHYPSQRMSEAAYDVGGSNLQDDYDESADYNGIWR